MTGTTNSRKFSNHKNVRGITLVELIVVISIIAIMSTAVVGSASVFLKRSTIQKNQNNAETIYQAAQAALQQMQKGGEEYKTESGKLKIKNAWVEDLMAQGTAYPFVSSNLSPEMEANKTYYSDRYDSDAFSTFNASTADTNESVHMRYVLTASKNNPDSDQSKLLRGLLLTYFNNIGTVQLRLSLTSRRVLMHTVKNILRQSACRYSLTPVPQTDGLKELIRVQTRLSLPEKLHTGTIRA